MAAGMLIVVVAVDADADLPCNAALMLMVVFMVRFFFVDHVCAGVPQPAVIFDKQK